jgi:hypothetical protein
LYGTQPGWSDEQLERSCKEAVGGGGGDAGKERTLGAAGLQATAGQPKSFLPAGRAAARQQAAPARAVGRRFPPRRSTSQTGRRRAGCGTRWGFQGPARWLGGMGGMGGPWRGIRARRRVRWSCVALLCQAA